MAVLPCLSLYLVCLLYLLLVLLQEKTSSLQNRNEKKFLSLPSQPGLIAGDQYLLLLLLLPQQELLLTHCPPSSCLLPVYDEATETISHQPLHHQTHLVSTNDFKKLHRWLIIAIIPTDHWL